MYPHNQEILLIFWSAVVLTQRIKNLGRFRCNEQLFSSKFNAYHRCRLPHTRTSVACWNYIWCVRLTGSRAQLVCSYFTKAQQSGPDFTHPNQTPVNAYCQLLSSFVPFHVRVKVSSLTFVIGNFRMSLLLFGFSSNQPPAKKAMRRKKESKSDTWKRENKQKMARLLEVSSQWWRSSVCGSLTMRWRAASTIIICQWVQNLQVGGK